MCELCLSLLSSPVPCLSGALGLWSLGLSWLLPSLLHPAEGSRERDPEDNLSLASHWGESRGPTPGIISEIFSPSAGLYPPVVPVGGLIWRQPPALVIAGLVGEVWRRSYGPARLGTSDVDSHGNQGHQRHSCWRIACDLPDLLLTVAAYGRSGHPGGPLPSGDRSPAHPMGTSEKGLHAAGGLFWMGMWSQEGKLAFQCVTLLNFIFQRGEAH